MCKEIKCFVCEEADITENDNDMMCEHCRLRTEKIVKVMSELDNAFDEVIHTDDELEISKKIGSLYWKKYWALYKIVSDVQARLQNEDLQFAKRFLEFIKNDYTKEEMKIAISEYIKEHKEESNNE